MAVALEVRDGAEIRIETGVGRVVKVEASAGKRNAKVTLEAKQLKDPLHGWADGSDAHLVAAVQTALASQQLVPYRIEVVRDKDAPKDVSIADLPGRSKFRRLIAIGPDAESSVDPWATAAADPATPPAAAQPARGAPAAAAPAQPSAEPAPEPATAVTASPALPAAPPLPTADELCSMSAQGRENVIGLWLVYYHDVIRAGSTQPVCEGVRQAALAAGASPEQLDAAAHRHPGQVGGTISPALRDAMKALRALTRDGVVDGEAFDAAMARMNELDATAEHFRWARELPAPDPSDGSTAPQTALAARQDPDRVGQRAGAPYDGSVTGPRPPVASHSGLGHRAAPRGLQDPPPFKRTYDDGPLAGRMNPSSYEVGEVAGLVKLAMRLLIRRARAIAGDEGIVVPPTTEQVAILSRALMLAADRVQISVRGAGSGVDRMSGLYRRATSAVWEAIDWYPYPGPDATGEEVAGWHAAVVDHASTAVRVAFELLGEQLPAPPPLEAEPVPPTADPADVDGELEPEPAVS